MRLPLPAHGHGNGRVHERERVGIGFPAPGEIRLAFRQRALPAFARRDGDQARLRGALVGGRQRLPIGPVPRKAR